MSNAISKKTSVGAEPWRRLWLPVESWEKHRGIDEDFLADYGELAGIADFTERVYPEMGTLSEHSDSPLLVMLGRPGAGKSMELRLAERERWFGGNAIFIEGKVFGVTDPGMYLREHYDEELKIPARIVIDGLDEILPANSRFIPQLKSWLKRQTMEHGKLKHSLAITCRWADWPEAEIAELANLWPDVEVKTIVLAPLSRVDAEKTLRNRLGEKAEDFWRQLHAHHLKPMACWPQGFLALIGGYEASGYKEVAKSYAEAIGAQVGRDLMLTVSRSETDRWERSVEGAEWRGRIAGRVAAAMAVSGASSFGFHDEAESGSFSISELSTSTEELDGKRITPTLKNFDDLVKCTNLMRQLPGGARWQFQSQVQQEWLAARWISDRKLSAKKLRQIFGIECEGEWTVAPSMRSTAAWTACFDKNFRKELLLHDPLTLLRMDGAGLPDSEREEIVEALLSRTNEVRVIDPAVWQSHVPSLKHGKLVGQLTRWLDATDVHEAAKELAVEVAEDTGLKEISAYFWNIYPDAEKNLKIRLARALGKISGDDSDAKWADVIAGKIPTDAHGTLLGYAMEIMVIQKRKITVRAVLGHVFPKRTFELFGIFEMAVRQLSDHLVTDDLPAVLRKLADNPHALHSTPSSHSVEFNAAALKLAFANLHNPSVASSLADYWQHCLTFHIAPAKMGATVDGKQILPDLTDERRREAAALFISHPGYERHKGKDWVFADHYLLDEADFDWCLERLVEATRDDKWRYAVLIGTMIWRVGFTPERAARFDALWEAEPELREILPKPEEGETISECITRILESNRTNHDEKHDHAQKRFEQRKLALVKRFDDDLAACRKSHEAGGIVWPSIYRFLSFRSSGSEMGIITFRPVATIRDDEGWMAEAAARFMVESPKKHALNHNFALYGALALAACERRIESDDSLRHVLEKHWLEVLIPFLSNHGLGEVPEEIGATRLANRFPESFVEAFASFVRKRYIEDAPLDELRSLEEIGLVTLPETLEKILLSENFHAAGFFNALHFLSETNELIAIRVLEVKVPSIRSGKPDAGSVAVLAAAMTLVSGRLTEEIKSHFLDEGLFALAIRFAVSRIRWRVRKLDFSAWPDLAVKHLAEACWRAYPVSDRHQNRNTFEFRAVTDDDEAMEFRDHISSAAWSRGIDLDIPENIEGENPEQARQRRHMIDWHKHMNRQIRVGHAWKPLSPKEFFWLTDQPNARLARNQDELMEALIESLLRWEESLSGGDWHRLWNSKKIKLEKVISREMGEWLHRDLKLPVECEPEPLLDRRVDLLLQINPADGISRSLQVVIEVKKLRTGNSGERKSAMKTQLMDRYLKPKLRDGWTHGLYTVAWTPTPGSPDDSEESLQKHRKELEKQAEDLSVEPFKLKSLVLDCRFRGKLENSQKN